MCQRQRLVSEADEKEPPADLRNPEVGCVENRRHDPVTKVRGWATQAVQDHPEVRTTLDADDSRYVLDQNDLWRKGCHGFVKHAEDVAWILRAAAAAPLRPRLAGRTA